MSRESIYCKYNNSEFQLITAYHNKARWQSTVDKNGEEIPITMTNVVCDNLVTFDFLHECKNRNIPTTLKIEPLPNVKYTNMEQLLEAVNKRISKEWPYIKMPPTLVGFSIKWDAYWTKDMEETMGLWHLSGKLNLNNKNEVITAKAILMTAPMFTQCDSRSFMPEALTFLYEMMLRTELSNYLSDTVEAWEMRDGQSQQKADRNFSGYRRRIGFQREDDSIKELSSEYTSDSKIMRRLGFVDANANADALAKLEQKVNDMFIEKAVIPAREITDEQEEAMTEIRRQQAANAPSITKKHIQSQKSTTIFQQQPVLKDKKYAKTGKKSKGKSS
jgi:hypothetical protein